MRIFQKINYTKYLYNFTKYNKIGTSRKELEYLIKKEEKGKKIIQFLNKKCHCI